MLPDADVNQPLKIYPLREGVGSDDSFPLFPVTFEVGDTVPPFGLNVIVYVVGAGALFIVYVAVTNALFVIPLFMAIALIVVVDVTEIAPVYFVLLDVGVVPLVV